MTRDPSDETKNLPPWLRDVPLPPRPRDAAERAAPPAPPAIPPADEGLPDWLRDSSAGTAGPPPAAPSWMDSPAQPPAPAQTSEQAALPDWLRDTQPSPPPSSTPEQLPSWLSDLAGPEAEASEPPPPPAPPTPESSPQESNLPDWLRDTQRDNPPSAGGEQLPSWLSETVETPADAGETPAWLGGLTAEPEGGEPAATPDWLSGPSDAASPAPSDTGVPAWLSAEGEPTAPPDSAKEAGEGDHPKPTGRETISLWGPEPTVPPEPQRSTGGEAGVPDWLRDISAGDTGDEITAEPFSFEGAIGAPQPAEPAGPPAWLSGGEDTAETVPDWLRSAVSQSEDLAGAAPEAPDVPLWLQDIGNEPASAPAAPTPPQTSDVPPPPAPAEEPLPPWLREETAQPPADVPAWLQEPEPSTQPPADVPTWLQETTSAPAESAPPFAEGDRDTLPGVLRPDLAGAQPAPPGQADELPDWLRPSAPAAAPDTGQGQDLPPWLRDEAGQPLPTAGTAGDTNLPAWLRGAPIEAAPAASAPSAEPPPPANFDWLDQAAEVEARRTTPESEFFGGTELPAWLRPPEPEQPKEISQADARSLDWLTRLGGLEEVETAAPTAVAAPRLTPPLTRSRSPAQIEALALMERLAAAPFPEAAPMPEQAQPAVWRRIGIERTLYLALLITLLIGLIVPVPESFGLAAPPSAPGAAELFGQIDKLSENDIVLIGYEWDARRSSELRPLEDAVLGHLIQRKVKLVLASTDPQGTLLLFDLRDQLEKAGYRKGGEDYILLGYKPGAELALRSFAQDFRAVLMSDFQGNDATISALATGADPSKPRLASLSDFSMVMVLADEAQDVQGWMEQVRRSTRQVPFGFLLPAETAPVVQPYLSQLGIYHLAGKQGALAYQSLRGGNGMPAAQIAREAAQQRLSQLIFVVLLLVGAIVVGASAAARRGRAP